jgi:hypothetical protein
VRAGIRRKDRCQEQADIRCKGHRQERADIRCKGHRQARAAPHHRRPPAPPRVHTLGYVIAPLPGAECGFGIRRHARAAATPSTRAAAPLNRPTIAATGSTAWTPATLLPACR